MRVAAVSADPSARTVTQKAKDLLRFKAVRVERIANVRSDTQLQPGDVVTIAAGKQIPAASIEHPVLPSDDAIVVVEKRAGLLSMGSDSEKERPRIGC